MDEKMKALGMWQAKVVKEFEDAGGEDAEANITTVKEYPDPVKEVSSASAPAAVAKKEKIEEQDDKTPTKEEKGKIPERAVATAPVVTPTPKEKIRHEFYQSAEKLTITVFAKGVPKDKGEIVIKEGSVRIRLLVSSIRANKLQLDISFPVLESNTMYDLSFDPLYARIDPSKSSYRITPHKIEIILHKAVPGPKWPSLEGAEAIAPTNSIATDEKPTIPAHVLSEKGPSYPTSSRHGPKDWDAVASSALKTKKSTENGEEKDVEEDDGEDGDPANAFFKQLYKNADPDTRRAMMKSYQESNGTALSTDWASVSKETVKTQPPEGVVAKKWGE